MPLHLSCCFFFLFSSCRERNNCICTFSGKWGYLQKVQGKSKKLERKGQPWAEASTFTTVMLVNSCDQPLLLSLKPPAYLRPWPPRSAHCLCTGPEGGTWTFHPEGKEEGNRENICKPMAAVTNTCSNNMGLNGNGWRQTAHLLPLRKAHYKISWKADAQRDISLVKMTC